MKFIKSHFAKKLIIVLIAVILLNAIVPVASNAGLVDIGANLVGRNIIYSDKGSGAWDYCRNKYSFESIFDGDLENG